jgi:hypothetical protein
MTKLLNKGFSFAETIILLAVLAILATLTTPDLLRFLRFYEARGEEVVLQKIKDALHAYAEDWGALPAEPLWFQDIAPYTDIGINQIQFDTWFRPRQYRVFTYNYGIGEEFRGQEIAADYALVMSYGEDGEVDADTVLTDQFGLITDLEPLTPVDDLGVWPPLDLDAIDVYSNLSPAGDDQIVVFTTLPQMANNLKVTKERLAVLRATVEKFAQLRESADPTPTNVLYRPPSVRPGGSPADPDTNYDPDVLADTVAFVGGPGRFRTQQAGDAPRRTAMIEFVRYLGLIDSYCCSAVRRFDHDVDPATPPVETPFFYYSNPRGTDVAPPACNPFRPSGPDNGEPFLPARILQEQGELNGNLNNCG